jgi:hypothetical protein
MQDMAGAHAITAEVGGRTAAGAPQSDAIATPMGIARLSKMMFDGVDLGPLWRDLIGKYIYSHDDAAALMDLATVEQLFGNREDGLARQAEALQQCRLYRSPGAAEPVLRLLAFAAAGEIGTNTPLEFLLEGSNVALYTLYIVPGLPLPETLPEHDLAIVAVGESDGNAPVHAEIARLVATWPRPVLNPPAGIARLSRAALWRLLDGAPGIVMPMTTRATRASLLSLVQGATPLTSLLPDGDFPLIIRPVGSHAGLGLEKLDSAAALAPYLAARDEDEFYISRFVDYRGADGFFRKFRVVFIAGRPFACHLAITDQWMIYYLNANMHESEAKRAEEAQFMEHFDDDFSRRHAAALTALAERVGLDYFGIDCAETPDGRLLVFEADVAMIVHAMDRSDLFPYKTTQMRKVFAAFRAMLGQRGAAPA